MINQHAPAGLAGAPPNISDKRALQDRVS